MTIETKLQAASGPVPTVTTGPMPASTKVFRPGTIYPDIRVPMRQISVHPSAG